MQSFDDFFENMTGVYDSWKVILQTLRKLHPHQIVELYENSPAFRKFSAKNDRSLWETLYIRNFGYPDVIIMPDFYDPGVARQAFFKRTKQLPFVYVVKRIPGTHCPEDITAYPTQLLANRYLEDFVSFEVLHDNNTRPKSGWLAIQITDAENTGHGDNKALFVQDVRDKDMALMRLYNQQKHYLTNIRHQSISERLRHDGAHVITDKNTHKSWYFFVCRVTFSDEVIKVR